MKIYISGEIAGDPNYKGKFARAAAQLERLGATVINPATAPEGLAKLDYMRICFAEMEAVDYVVFLPDWVESADGRLGRFSDRYACKEVTRLHIPRAAGCGASGRGRRRVCRRVLWMPEELWL